MIKVFTLATALLLGGYSSDLNTEEPVSTDSAATVQGVCGSKNSVYQDGEMLTYKVYYNWTALWVTAGEVNFKVKEKELNGRKVHHAVSMGRSYPSFDKIYKIRDRYETYIDQETQLPLEFYRSVNEGGYSFKRQYKFNHEQGSAFAEYERNEKVRQNVVEDLPSCTHDMVSIIYQMRSLDLDAYKPGDKIPMTVLIDEKPADLYVKYVGKEVRKTKQGKFNCIIVKPLLIAGDYFKGGEGMTIWVSDDKNHVPVRIEAELAVGSIKADLKSYSGLRHDFDAIID